MICPLRKDQECLGRACRYFECLSTKELIPPIGFRITADTIPSAITQDKQNCNFLKEVPHEGTS